MKLLGTRNAAKSKNNVALDQTFLLPKAGSGQPANAYEYLGVPLNQMVVVSSNRAIRIVLTRESGELDLGLNTIIVLTDSFVKLRFSNDANEGDAEVNLVVV